MDGRLQGHEGRRLITQDKTVSSGSRGKHRRGGSRRRTGRPAGRPEETGRVVVAESLAPPSPRPGFCHVSYAILNFIEIFLCISILSCLDYLVNLILKPMR